jgi:hypothetical protein
MSNLNRVEMEAPGDRVVRFEYCISFVFLTWRRESEEIALRDGQSAAIASLPYCLISLFLGWWGIPWGVFLTPICIWRNLKGGRPVTIPGA